MPLLALIAVARMFYDCETSKQSAWKRIKNPETLQLLKHFVAVKEAQACASTSVLPSEIRAIFRYADRGDWLALSNSVQRVQERYRYWYSLNNGYQSGYNVFESYERDFQRKFIYKMPPFRLQGTQGETALEVYGAFDGFMTGGEKYATEFGREIIDSIPPGSIYFGGTAPGRFIVTAMCKSQTGGDPFFTLTQNSLADGFYVDYLRLMYGKKIYIPTDQDIHNAFVADEKFARTNQSGVTGQVAVMQVNGLIAKAVFEKKYEK